MSTQYPELYDRPIYHWKVTELKGELKRRKLTTKGLKEDLIKRLDEAIRIEREAEIGNGFDCDPELVVKFEDGEKNLIDTEVVKATQDHGESKSGKVDDNATVVEIDDSPPELGQGKVQDVEIMSGSDSAAVVEELSVIAVSVETSRSVVTQIASNCQQSQDSEIQKENVDSKPLHEDAMLHVPDPNDQVPEVIPVLGFQVKPESISTDFVSISEKNELKDNLNADNVHLELDVVEPQMVRPSSSDVPPSGGDLHTLDDQRNENQGFIEEIDDNNATNVDLIKKSESADGGSSEKLNLDRSSGDDSMEEDVLESKQIDSNPNTDEVGDKLKLTNVCVVKEEGPVDATGPDISLDKKEIPIENKNSIAGPVEKRNLQAVCEDQEAVGNNEPIKRQRRWHSESVKIPKLQSSDLTSSTTPKDAFQPNIPKRNFTRSDFTLSGDVLKERVVPPSSKPPTNSLRVDRFLRPFTLKAVQELLAKTGNVCSFWMDHIKTHCYVTYSLVEEAIQTRNAVYNLQWPSNGGRLLVAEFVDPQEVKVRVETPPQSPAATISTGPSAPPVPSPFQPQPSTRQHVLRQQLPLPLPLPPPPPISDPSTARERLTLPPRPPISDPSTTKERLTLPHLPPLAEKHNPPIVTLDDLFRKTRATPRIYYLPLSEEQVAVKLAARSKNTK